VDAVRPVAAGFGGSGFLAQPEVKDLRALLQVVTNAGDSQAACRVLAMPGVALSGDIIMNIAAGARGHHVQKGSTDKGCDFHDDQCLPQADSALACVDSQAQHQEVARDRHRHASFLNQDDDEASKHPVLIEETRKRKPNGVPPLHMLRGP